MHTRSVVFIGVLTVLGFALEPVGAGHASDSEPTAYIVGFHELPDDRARYQGEPVTGGDEALSFLVVTAHDPDGFEQRAKGDDRVRYLEVDHHDWELAYTPNDALYGDAGHYGTRITNTESAWDTTLGSTAVKIGLLDTGINAGHEDFVDARVSGWDYVNDDGTIDDSGHCSYHGSHTSGTAAATIDNGVGIAGMSQSSIIMQKIFDKGGFMGCGATSTSQIAKALTDLGDQGAHVSSNSWGGGGSSTTLNDAIAYAHDKGTIHVAAAGNSGTCTDCVSQPWKDNPSKTVIVTCSDETDGFCSFSSQGPEVDLIAPGDDILSVDGGGGYRTMSGTSMSAPHVSGAIGLYVAANGDAAFSTVEDALKASADDIGHSVGRQGGGRLNTGAFVGGGDGGGDTNSAPTADFTYACTDLSCDFDGTGSTDSDGSIASYAWDLGDGATATGSTVSHTYTSGGEYTVTLTVTDDDGATDTASQAVTVSDSTSNGEPTADFTSSCTDLSCDFDGTSSSDPDGDTLTYTWDLGDGTTATGATVSHTYASAGDYTVTLTVDDGNGGSDTTSQTVSVADTSDGFSLTATGYKVKGRHHADLEWSGATSTDVDIYVDGALHATTANDGFYTWSSNIVGSGSYTFQVCEAGTTTCSNEATVLI